MKARATELILSSQTSCRVLLIGIVLSCLHTAGKFIKILIFLRENGINNFFRENLLNFNYFFP